MVPQTVDVTLFVLSAPLVAVVAHKLFERYTGSHNIPALNAVGIAGACTAYYLSSSPSHFLAYYLLFMGMVFAQSRVREMDTTEIESDSQMKL